MIKALEIKYLYGDTCKYQHAPFNEHGIGTYCNKPALDNHGLCKMHYDFCIDATSEAIQSSIGLIAQKTIKELFKQKRAYTRRPRVCPHCGGTL